MIQTIKNIICSDDDTEKRGPCCAEGHEYYSTHSVHYHARGVPHFGLDTSFKVKKKIPEECFHCGRYREREEAIGKVKIDKETDEMTVVQ